MTNDKKTKKGFGKGFTFIFALVIVVAGFLAYTHITNDNGKSDDKANSKQTTKNDKKKNNKKESKQDKIDKIVSKIDLKDYDKDGNLKDDVSPQKSLYLADTEEQPTDYEGALKRIYELEMRLNKYDKKFDVDSADTSTTDLKKGTYAYGSDSKYQEYADYNNEEKGNDDSESEEEYEERKREESKDKAEKDDEEKRKMHEQESKSDILDGIEDKQSNKIEFED